MKVAIIGYGNVGLECFRQIQQIHRVDEVTLVGRNIEKMRGEIRDYRDAQIISGSFVKLSFGGYEATAGADIIIYTISIKMTVKDRMDLLEGNIELTKETFKKIKQYNDHAIIIVLTNPVDVIVTSIVYYTGFPPERVLSTGTMLDTARFKRFLADFFEVAPTYIDANVVGEHGFSAASLIDETKIHNIPLKEYIQKNISENAMIHEDAMNHLVTQWGLNIYNDKGNTTYGVVACAAAIVKAIISNENVVMNVSSVLQGEYGVDGYALSVPCVIGATGRKGILNIKMSDKEQEAFEKSARILKEACDRVGVTVRKTDLQ